MHWDEIQGCMDFGSMFGLISHSRTSFTQLYMLKQRTFFFLPNFHAIYMLKHNVYMFRKQIYALIFSVNDFFFGTLCFNEIFK